MSVPSQALDRSASRAVDLRLLLERAAGGDPEAVDALLARCRPYLRLVCSARFPAMIRGREDASDIVQKTLADAAAGVAEFRGRSASELQAWLLRMLERNLLQAVRRHTAGKRDVRREGPIDPPNESGGLAWPGIDAGDTSPSLRVFRGEAAILLAEAVERLPPGQREAVVMRYLSHETLVTIAQRLGVTQPAAAGLVRRGVAALRMMVPRELADSQ